MREVKDGTKYSRSTGKATELTCRTSFPQAIPIKLTGSSRKKSIFFHDGVGMQMTVFCQRRRLSAVSFLLPPLAEFPHPMKITKL